MFCNKCTLTSHIQPKDMCKLSQITKFSALITLIIACALKVDPPQNLLDRKITFKVYEAERLESVVFRMESKLGLRIGFSVGDFLPYKARAATYRDTRIREVLDEQLAATLLTYEIRNGRLFIIKTASAKASEKK